MWSCITFLGRAARTTSSPSPGCEGAGSICTAVSWTVLSAVVAQPFSRGFWPYGKHLCVCVLACVPVCVVCGVVAHVFVCVRASVSNRVSSPHTNLAFVAEQMAMPAYIHGGIGALWLAGVHLHRHSARGGTRWHTLQPGKSSEPTPYSNATSSCSGEVDRHLYAFLIVWL